MEHAAPSAVASPGLPPALRDALGRRADASGFVRFDRFMDVVLYGEGVGYYARPTPPFGPGGDFYTAPRVSPLFGRSLVAHLAAVRAELGRGRPFTIAEIGPGDGTLAESVLAPLAGARPEADAVEYVVIERSPALARIALERASRAAEGSGIAVRAQASLGDLGPFEGAVVANEVLDAQPARRLRWDGRAFEELGVRLEGDRIFASARSPADPIPGPPPPAAPGAGVVVEISPTAEGLVREVADHLLRGVAIFLDYGLEESALLASHPEGTLAAVRGHRFVDDPLSAPGTTDLSTFVNFSRIREVARRAGLVERAFLPQSEGLGAWGFPRWLEEAQRSARSAEERVRIQFAAKNLLFGFERFRLLELAPPGRTAPEAEPT